MKYEGVKWVWFDLDDTLIDFHANSRLANAIIYREAGLDRYYASPEQWIEAYEGHNRLLWDRYSRGEIPQGFFDAIHGKDLFFDGGRTGAACRGRRLL